MRWNPFNGKKQGKGGKVAYDERPTTFEAAQNEYNQLTIQLGHHTHQRDVVIPKMIADIHKRMTFLEEHAERLQAEKDAREKGPKGPATVPPVQVTPETKAA